MSLNILFLLSDISSIILFARFWRSVKKVADFGFPENEMSIDFIFIVGRQNMVFFKFASRSRVKGRIDVFSVRSNIIFFWCVGPIQIDHSLLTCPLMSDSR